MRENRDYLKKNSGFPKFCACVAKPFDATIERVTSTKAKDSKEELWKTMDMDLCQSIAKC